MREAREVLDRKDEVLAKADEEAALRLSRADDEIDRRIGESAITKAAEERAEQIISGAQGETERLMQEAQNQAAAKRAEGEHLASEQMDEADRYAMEMLRKLDQQLDAFSASVRAGIETLDRTPAETAVPGRPVEESPLPRAAVARHAAPQPTAPPPLEEMSRGTVPAVKPVPSPVVQQEALEPPDGLPLPPANPDSEQDNLLQRTS